MNKKEKMGIAILVVLVIILAISVWAQRNANPTVKLDCNSLCIKIGNSGWIFPGFMPTAGNAFPTQEDCAAACRAKFRRQ